MKNEPITIACNAAEAVNWLFGSAGFIEAVPEAGGQIDFCFDYSAVVSVRRCAVTAVVNELQSIAGRLRVAVFQLSKQPPPWPTWDCTIYQRLPFDVPASVVCDRLESLNPEDVEAVPDGDGGIRLLCSVSRTLDGSLAPNAVIIETIQDIASECERLAVAVAAFFRLPIRNSFALHPEPGFNERKSQSSRKGQCDDGTHSACGGSSCSGKPRHHRPTDRCRHAVGNHRIYPSGARAVHAKWEPRSVQRAGR